MKVSTSGVTTCAAKENKHLHLVAASLVVPARGIKVTLRGAVRVPSTSVNAKTSCYYAYRLWFARKRATEPCARGGSHAQPKGVKPASTFAAEIRAGANQTAQACFHACARPSQSVFAKFAVVSDHWRQQDSRNRQEQEAPPAPGSCKGAES